MATSSHPPDEPDIDADALALWKEKLSFLPKEEVNTAGSAKFGLPSSDVPEATSRPPPP